MRRVGFLIWKELIELRRDPRLFGIVIIAPVLQLFLLAYAATTDVRNVPIVVRGRGSVGGQPRADRAVHGLAQLLAGRASSRARTRSIRYLEHGTRLACRRRFPPATADGFRPAGPQTVQIIADGSDANSAGVSLGYATNLIAQYGAGDASARMTRIVAGQSARATASLPDALEPRVRVWFNPRLQSRDFMIPGIVALLLLVITTNLSSMGIVRERELGTLEQLNVTPLQPVGVDCRQAVPYGLGRPHRCRAGAVGVDPLVPGADARAAWCCCSR